MSNKLYKKGFYIWDESLKDFRLLAQTEVSSWVETPTFLDLQGSTNTLYILTSDSIVDNKTYKKGIYIWNETIGFINVVYSENGIMVVSTMPSPTADNLNYTYFYIGETAGGFKTKTFYRCVEITPSTDPKTYKYEEYIVASDVFVDTDDLATITNPSKQVVYRLQIINYKYNNEVLEVVQGYKILDSTKIAISNENQGLQIEGLYYNWSDLTDTIIQNTITNNWMSITIRDNSNKNSFDTSFNNNEFVMFKIDTDNYVFRTSITKDDNYKLYHNPTETSGVGNFIKIGGSEGGVSDYDDLENKPSIDNTTLVKGQTHQDLKLISKDDFHETTPEQVQQNGVDIVLNNGTNANPDIIQDGIEYQYATNKTSSNNKIWTKMDEIERKADAKTNTKFVQALPDPVEPNTEYYVETDTANVYQRYFVDSTLTVKNLGTTQIEVSTLLSKQEATTLYIPKTSKVTDLEGTVSNDNVAGAEAIKDYVDNHGGMLQETETTLWTGSQGQASNITITLSDGLSNYKYLKFYSTKSTNWIIDKASVSDINDSSSSKMIILESGWDSNLRYIRFYKISNTQIMLENIVDITITKIVGVKVSPINPENMWLTTKTYAKAISVAGGINSWSINITVDDGYKVVSATPATEGNVGTVYINTNGIKQTGNIVSISGWYGGLNQGNQVAVTLIAVKGSGLTDRPYKVIYESTTRTDTINLTDNINNFQYLEFIGQRAEFVCPAVKVLSTKLKAGTEIPIIMANWDTAGNWFIAGYNSDTLLRLTFGSGSYVSAMKLIKVIGWY